MSLIEQRHSYKPFAYPWCFEAWHQQQRIHWLPEEVPMSDDVLDWEKRLSDSERNLLTQIFRFFTQGDIEVADCYNRHYSRVFKPVEVQMMLSAFANMETVHIAAYSLLMETIGMPEGEYSAFMRIAPMRAKFDYMQQFNVDDPYQVALTLAAFGAFTEGLQLFASFAILMNFPRQNKMKGMGQIVSWSVRDESLHTASIIRLYHEWLAENPQIDRAKIAKDLTQICRDIVAHEDAFIDVAFEQGDVAGLSPEQVKTYIRFVANLRLRQLGLEAAYPGHTVNPLPWLDNLIGGLEHANFFEARATEYSRAATKGTWEDAYS